MVLNALSVDAGDSQVYVLLCANGDAANCATYFNINGMLSPAVPISCFTLPNMYTLTGTSKIALRVTCASGSCSNVSVNFVASCPPGYACTGDPAQGSFTTSCSSCVDDGCGTLSNCVCSDESGGLVTNPSFNYAPCGGNGEVINNNGVLQCFGPCPGPAVGSYAQSCQGCVGWCGFLQGCQCTNEALQQTYAPLFFYDACPGFDVSNLDGALACSPPTTTTTTTTITTTTTTTTSTTGATQCTWCLPVWSTWSSGGSSSSSSSSSGLSMPAYIGIGVGGAVVVLVAVGLGFVFWRRHQRLHATATGPYAVFDSRISNPTADAGVDQTL